MFVLGATNSDVRYVRVEHVIKAVAMDGMGMWGRLTNVQRETCNVY